MINYIPRRFTIVRDKDLCINCGCCVRQCANECHFFSPKDGETVVSKSDACVACHRCVDLCPTGALRIEKYVCDYRETQTGLRIISRRYAARQTQAQPCFPQWATQSRFPFIGIRFC